MIIKVFNYYQTCWIELFIEYDFILISISESKNSINNSSWYSNYIENIIILNNLLFSLSLQSFSESEIIMIFLDFFLLEVDCLRLAGTEFVLFDLLICALANIQINN